jgi:hypothetical protein
MMPVHGIAQMWPSIKEFVVVGAPKEARSKISLDTIFDSLMKGNMQCWACFVDSTLTCVAFTSFIYDGYMRSKSLYIYSLYNPTWSVMTKDVWRRLIEEARKFARERGCNSITGMSKMPTVLEAVREMGGKTEMVLIELEV